MSGVATSDGTAAAPTFKFKNEENTGRFRPGSGRVGETVLGVQIREFNGTTAAYIMNSGDTVGFERSFRKSRGTPSSPAIVSSGDTLGGIAFYAYDGANYLRAAEIGARQNAQAPSAGEVHGDLVFYVTAGSGSVRQERMRLDCYGHFGVNKIPGQTGNLFEIGRTSGGGGLDEAMSLEQYNNDSDGFPLQFYKSRNITKGSHTIVNNGDALGNIIFRGSDGTAFRSAASIKAEVDGVPGSGDMPGRLLFFTTPDGSVTLAERMRISSAGVVNIAGLTASRPVFTDASKNLVSGSDWFDQPVKQVSSPTFGGLTIQDNITSPAIRIGSTANVYSDMYFNAWNLDRVQFRVEAVNPGSGSGTGSGKLSILIANNPTLTACMSCNTSGLKIYAVDDGAHLIISSAQTTNNQYILLRNPYYTDNATAGVACIGWRDTGSSGGELYFGTTTNGGGVSGIPTERMRIDNAGRVGIGATSPACGLDVEKGVGNTVAKFGSSGAVYMIYSTPTIGFNAYFSSTWKFGKGSSSKYGGILEYYSSSNYFLFSVSSAAGDADATMTEQNTFKIGGTSYSYIDLVGKPSYGGVDNGTGMRMRLSYNDGTTHNKQIAFIDPDYDANAAATGVRIVSLSGISYVDCIANTNNTAKALRFQDINGVYISANNVNSICVAYNTNATADLWLNLRGYQDDNTQYRDLYIGDGKGNQVASFSGSTASLWVSKNVSAESFTDRTPGFDLATSIEIAKSIEHKDGKLDHSKGHKSVETEQGRDLSGTVSALHMVAKHLLEENTLLKERLSKLEALVEALG